jgi:hypothetical protein
LNATSCHSSSRRSTARLYRENKLNFCVQAQSADHKGVQDPIKLDLVVNLTTARALGLEVIPPTAVGRMLDRDEAAKLIRRIERGIPKRPAAASVRRAVSRKRA